MDFIETLKSVDGVKLCPRCTKDPNEGVYDPIGKVNATLSAIEEALKKGPCQACHGTGQVLDLAPLLAKPKELEKLMPELLVNSGIWTTSADDGKKVVYSGGHLQNLHVVGPQRASNLVYEVARQLGGTAVVAEPVNSVAVKDKNNECWTKYPLEDLTVRTSGYRLSLIPPDATVLFVTDRFNMEEVLGMRRTMWNKIRGGPKSLPYVLALVSSCEKHIEPNNETYLDIISLHQEKP